MGNPAVDAQRHKGRSLRSGAIPPRTGGFTNYPPITTVFPQPRRGAPLCAPADYRRAAVQGRPGERAVWGLYETVLTVPRLARPYEVCSCPVPLPCRGWSWPSRGSLKAAKNLSF